MAKGPSFGSRGGGATLEKSKVSFKQEAKSFQPRIDDNGGGGSNGGKIFNGGGGGDDGGDDDDYFDFNEDGEGGDGDGWLRQIFPENYSRIAIQAILEEWFRTVAGLPLWLRGMVEMGLFSSQQLARFFTLDMRPSLVRNLSRNLPVGFQRELVGRLMADPAFVQKMMVDQAVCVGVSLSFEAAQRGDRFMKELDLVAANTLSMSVAHGTLMWMLAPSRSFGAAYKLPFQEMLASLPNNVFDKSTKHKQFTLGQRAMSAVAKAAELSAVGALAGTSMSLLGNAAVSVRRTQDPGFTPSVPVPGLATSAAGGGAFMGLHANLRYQVLNGLERYAFERAPILPIYLALSTALRTASAVMSKDHQLAFMGLPTGLRPVEGASSSKKQATTPRRVVRRKVVRNPAAVPAVATEAAAPVATSTDAAVAPVVSMATA